MPISCQRAVRATLAGARGALRWALLSPVTGAHVALLAIVVVAAMSSAAARSFLTEREVLNESASKRPGNVQFLAYTPTTTAAKVTSLTAATEVFAKNLTDQKVRLSIVNGSDCVGSGVSGTATIASGTTQVFVLDSLGDSITMPIPRTSAIFAVTSSSYNLCAASEAAVGNSQFLYITERDQ